MTISNRIIVVGVGNLLLKDEGIGVHVAHALQEMRLPTDIEIIDGGTAADLLTCLEPADKLIIIDAVEGRGETGAIYRFHPDDLSSDDGVSISLHEVGVMTSLKMMRLTRNEPKETIIIGIQPKEIDWGTELSSELQEKVHEVVKVVLKEIGLR
ncbi:hydrogenase maturation protease [Chloroflexota bacterium]